MQQLLITGANRGIGLEFTQQYLAQGWHVYATYRQQPGEALAALACDQLTLLPPTFLCCTKKACTQLRGGK